MNRSHSTLYIALIGSIVLLLIISSPSFASTISGKVVDEEGNPVPDVMVSIKSFKGNFLPDRHGMHMREAVFPPPQPSNTDPTGAFSIENIVAPSVNTLTLFPERNSEYEIRTIEIQGITFNIHPHQFHWHEGFPFGIEEETDEIDVKITVRQRMRIRGQVLKADGTPLQNTQVNLSIKSRYVGGGSSRSSGSTHLDAEGNFTEYVDSSAYYTVTVKYQGQSATSQGFLLKEGQRLDGLTLTLEGEQQVPQQPGILVQPNPNLIVPDVVRVEAIAPPIPKRRDELVNMRLRQALMKRRRAGVWAVNPANRHAYKLINATTPEEALTIAAAQNAHLAAINNKEEQQWLLDVYGEENYWIGFTDGLKQPDKKWDNGDPITYTNWDTQKLLSAPDKSSEKDEIPSKTYTVLIGVTGKWQQVREDNPIVSITKKAILEKKDLVVGMPIPDAETE